MINHSPMITLQTRPLMNLDKAQTPSLTQPPVKLLKYLNLRSSVRLSEGPKNLQWWLHRSQCARENTLENQREHSGGINNSGSVQDLRVLTLSLISSRPKL